MVDPSLGVFYAAVPKPFLQTNNKNDRQINDQSLILEIHVLK